MSNDKHDRNLDEIARALQEAWLNRLGLTRFFRFIATILISVIAAVTVTDARTTDAQREGCERRQQIFVVIRDILSEVVANQQRELVATKSKARQKQIRTAIVEYKRRVDVISDNIVANCDEVYPHILPFIE